ncbi:MAG: sulfite exporter TauE/SafE family protein [Actinomycetia bacterium]|nr:sulfite exporter TauE/SafE family protein [Actinomycetes bacterium]
MSFWPAVAVFVAGVWAGTINTVVGSGTLLSFPVLLAVGLSPLSANVTNTLGLFPGSFTGAYGYRRELAGQGERIVPLTAAVVLGSVTGSLLLLKLPPGAFKAIVPVLIGLAVLLVIFGRRLQRWLGAHSALASERVTAPLWCATAVTGAYGGYFGAAQGVLQMGFFGIFLADDIQRQNALKNLLAGFVNLVAAIVFVIVGKHIDWAAAGLLAAGSICGGVLGARIGHRLPPGVLRAVIVLVGVAAIIRLLV